MKKFFLYFFIFVFLTSSILLGVFYYNLNKPSGFNEAAEKQLSLNNNSIQNAQSKGAESKKRDETRDSSEKLPKEALLDLVFVPQAPFGNWDPLHEDACEEASILMLQRFMENKRSISLEKEDDELKLLVAYQEARGYGPSITLNELKTISERHLGMNRLVVKKVDSNEDIKKELAAGRPVIVGAAGKLLANPNFRDGGPVYHMLIVKGYDTKGFITNDPGTRMGEGYHYTYDVFWNALHDYNASDISKGEKNMLTVSN